ncbi:hypothetical protein [Kaarinaea lacus]
MNNLILLILLLSLSFVVHAAVYKHVDDEGNVIKYSDMPQKPGDKPINVPPPAMEFKSTTPPASTVFQPDTKSSKQTEKEERKPVTAYVAVTIMNMQDDQGIRANGGIFPIKLASQPALDAEAGHRYAVVIDNEPHQTSDKASFELQNLLRGTHSIQAQVKDRDGSVLASSSPITIHILRR